ncbi:MAG: HDOD domain-containing protein [Planctomycetota bacterium]|jgi:HD-like signal output (HDOD) protein
MLWTKLSERVALATGNFVKLFDKIDVPSLPEAATRLLKAFGAEVPDMSELNRLITGDVGLSTKILSTVNSAYYGVRHKVSSVQQAISLLGIKRIRSLTVAFVVSQRLPAKAAGFNRLAFWQSSIQRGVFAQQLAAIIAPGTEDEAFTGALLQDMALPILLSRWSTHYLPVVELAESSERPLYEVENERLSWNHAQAGAWMARNWGLPDVLVCCVGLHHATPDDLESVGFENTPIAAAAISSRLPDAEGVCREKLQLSPEQYGKLCQDTDAACVELSALFNVPNPSPLAETHAHVGS